MKASATALYQPYAVLLYGYTMTKLKRDYQVAYSDMLRSGG